MWIKPAQRPQYWRCHSHTIAEKLGFSAVNYNFGAWFDKSDTIGTQIDLVFIRAEKVITLCEIKYQKYNIGKEVIDEVEKKIQNYIK